jgi:dUTP pyrophosphatase
METGRIGRLALRGGNPAHDISEGPVLRIQTHFPGMTLPARVHPDDAGLDLTAMAVEPLRPRVFSFDMGVSVQAPDGFYCEVAPRSSIVKTDFVMANSVGIIDPGYRGRVRVVMRYLGEGDGAAEAQALVGTRIAQLLVRRREALRVEPAEFLEQSARGTGGFGSSGS